MKPLIKSAFNKSVCFDCFSKLFYFPAKKSVLSSKNLMK